MTDIDKAELVSILQIQNRRIDFILLLIMFITGGLTNIAVISTNGAMPVLGMEYCDNLHICYSTLEELKQNTHGWWLTDLFGNKNIRFSFGDILLVVSVIGIIWIYCKAIIRWARTDKSKTQRLK